MERTSTLGIILFSILLVYCKGSVSPNVSSGSGGGAGAGGSSGLHSKLESQIAELGLKKEENKGEIEGIFRKFLGLSALTVDEKKDPAKIRTLLSTMGSSKTVEVMLRFQTSYKNTGALYHGTFVEESCTPLEKFSKVNQLIELEYDDSDPIAYSLVGGGPCM